MALLYAMGSKESTDMLREEKSSDLHQNCTVYGGADRTRTDYLYTASVALSQVSYNPMCTYYTAVVGRFQEKKKMRTSS